MKITPPKPKQIMPEDADLKFKGKIFSLYQWQQKMYDNSLATYERLKRADTVNIIPVIVNKKIIVTQQEQPARVPFVGLAGGVVDPGEEILAAAKRELLEETGYEAKKYELLHAAYPSDKIEWAVYTFIAKDCKKVAKQNLDAGEKIDLLFLNFDEFIELMYDENYRDTEVALKILREIKTNKGREELKEMFGLS